MDSERGLESGRLTPAYLRFYHAMYQTMMFGMNLAFVSNNIGLMWVAVEIAALTTVLMNQPPAVMDRCLSRLAVRGEPRDWWALAWLRGTEWFTDVLWASSPAVSRPGAKAGLRASRWVDALAVTAVTGMLIATLGLLACAASASASRT